MYWESYVKECIAKYPLLYKTSDYWRSEHLVANHVFLTLGNGLEWAHVKNPKRGGFLVEPRYRKYRGEYVRIYDKPYGKETYDKELFNRVWTERIFTFYNFPKEDEDWDPNFTRDVFESEITEDLKDMKRFELSIDSSVKRWNKLAKKMENEKPTSWFSPYPDFGEEYSCFYKPEVKYIQDDWKEAAIKHLDFCRDFVSDKNDLKFISETIKLLKT